MPRADRDCECLQAGPLPGSRASSYLGIDAGGRRFAEVEIEECTRCRRQWLHYEVGGGDSAMEARWFRGVLSKEAAESVTAATALEFLGSLEWYFRGGVRFGSETERASGRPDVSG